MHRYRMGTPSGNQRGGCWRYAAYRDMPPEVDEDEHNECGFVVQDAVRYMGSKETFKAPTVLGSFSVDGSKNVTFDKSMMPVLNSKYKPSGNSNTMKIALDLNTGWHRVKAFTGTSALGFSQLLQWIINNQDKLLTSDLSSKLKVDVVCSRKLLKNIMTAPYAHYEAEWEMLAQYYKGIVYLVNVDKEECERNKDDPISLIEIYGHKFEHYMTGGDPEDELDCDCQFRCVLQLQLNDMAVLFAPDTDAVDMECHKDNFTDMSSFVRLKSALEMQDSRKQSNFKRNTCLNWWAENMLTGVPKLILGTRNKSGVVHTLKMMHTLDLPDMGQGMWEPSVCINFLNQFLGYVREKVSAEPLLIHSFKKSQSVKRFIIHSNDTDHLPVLPSWYTDCLFTKTKKK